jgi:hypothetical protein
MNDLNYAVNSSSSPADFEKSKGNKPSSTFAHSVKPSSSGNAAGSSSSTRAAGGTGLVSRKPEPNIFAGAMAGHDDYELLDTPDDIPGGADSDFDFINISDGDNE